MRANGIMARARVHATPRSGKRSVLLLVFMACAFGAAPEPASAMQVLDAADHAELTAQVSATAVSRIVLSHDRIARVIRSPGGFETEHDPGSGDLYLRPSQAVDGPVNGPVDAPMNGPGDDAGGALEPEAAPVALFIGTEKGFTYRLTLTVAERGSAQILIRNAAAAPAVRGADRAPAGATRIGTLVGLVRAVARREPPAGFAIDAASGIGAAIGTGAAGPGDGGPVRLIETWRGPRFEARVVEVAEDLFSGGTLADAAGLAARLGPGSGSGIAAAWLAGPGTGPHGGRIAVLVRETARPAGDTRAGDTRAGDTHAGDTR